MPLKTTFIKRLLLPAALLLLAIAWFCGRLTDITMVDLTSGFSHPLDGWDHLVTMLAVGIWAAQLRGKAIWLLPLTFVSVMSLGGISGAAKYLVVPSAEILIVLSGLVFSVLIIRKVRFTTQINVLIVAFFAFFSRLCTRSRNLCFSKFNFLHARVYGGNVAFTRRRNFDCKSHFNFNHVFHCTTGEFFTERIRYK